MSFMCASARAAAFAVNTVVNQTIIPCTTHAVSMLIAPQFVVAFPRHKHNRISPQLSHRSPTLSNHPPQIWPQGFGLRGTIPIQPTPRSSRRENALPRSRQRPKRGPVADASTCDGLPWGAACRLAPWCASWVDAFGGKVIGERLRRGKSGQESKNRGGNARLIVRWLGCLPHGQEPLLQGLGSTRMCHAVEVQEWAPAAGYPKYSA